MTRYEDIVINQGADIAIEVNLIDPETNSAKDLTGYTVSSKMKRSYSSTESTSFICNVSDAVNGKFIMLLDHNQTDALKAGRYVYDVEISFVSETDVVIIERILEGRITVTPSVTR